MKPDPQSSFVISREHFDAVIFDLDGVVTRTATVHAAAWKRLFDEYLDERLRHGQPAYAPFDVDTDYLEYVDGKPRYDGIRSFLESRQIDLPHGTPNDSPEQETVCGLGNRKNRLFLESLEHQGVQVYDSTVRLIKGLRAGGFLTAIISASDNCSAVLQRAGLEELFDAKVDGVECARLRLKGKPAPDVFIEAAKRLGVQPERAVVVEDAIAGVKAGHAGGFGRVIGVDRRGRPERLRREGADVVVADLAEVTLADEASSGNRDTAELPSALDQMRQLLGNGGKRLAVFLDYDGTLTPIVSRPEAAVLSDRMRTIIRRLAGHCAVAVVSGRGLADVRERVGIEEIVYAGSHGFEIAGPGGLREENREAQAAQPALAEAEAALREQLSGVPGAQVERKKYSLAIHFRNVDEQRVPEVERSVAEIARQHPTLRRSGGKKVFELQPEVDWHKGRAVNWLLTRLDLDHPDVLPLYIGDDLTDEDAFQAMCERGVGIVVRDEPRPTAARYALENPAEVGTFLERLTGYVQRSDA
jgi:trehalose-phosphatase